MKILNFGSLNIDYVYSVPHFVRAGETLSSFRREIFVGGKGLNQSIALARAGAHVYHAGCIGTDGEFLIDIYYGLTKALGVQIEPNFGPDRAGDIKHSNADISKARKNLGYDPDWSFQKGIAAAIEWYKENL